MSYIEGFVAAVPRNNKEAYRQHASGAVAMFKEFGATRQVETWGDDVPDGKVTDFKGAVKATGDEQVVFSWIEWPSKEVRDAGWAKAFADPRMRTDNAPYDERRRVHGGFVPLLDEQSAGATRA